MGWKEFFGIGSQAALEAANAVDIAVASPFAGPSHLNQVVWPDIMGADWLPLTRAEAMAVPAVARSRGLITGTIARLELEAIKDGEPLEDVPLWMNRTDSPLPPYHRMLWTIDDLVFYGYSLWAVDRDIHNQVIKAYRVPFQSWEFNSEGQITVDGKLVRADSVILIPGPHEGLIQFASRTIRQASSLLQSADKAARNQTAYLELHQTNEAPMTQEAIGALIKGWSDARNGVNGGVAFTNNGIEVREHGAPQEHLLIEGRNASAVDIARCMGVPAALIDAQAQQGALTYETTQDRNAQFLTYGLAPYMDAVSARLSQDDVAPRKTKVAFAFQDFIGDVKLPVEDQKSRVVTDEELRVLDKKAKSAPSEGEPSLNERGRPTEQ